MKPKFAKRYCFLKDGAHVVIVINAKNIKASITTAMIAATCKLLHVPVICATVGHASGLLSRALGAKNVIQTNYPFGQQPRPLGGSLSPLENPNKMIGYHDLQALMHDVRENRAILLLDVIIDDDFDGSIFVDAMRLHRKETISIVWPVYNEQDIKAGPGVINRVKPEQCMVHLHDFGYAGISKCGTKGHFLGQFPIWQSEGLTEEMMDVMKRANQYSYLPPFPELSQYYDDLSDYIPTGHKQPIFNLLCHLYSAGEATTQKILNPIIGDMF
jgi:hypothetical protein